MAITARTTRPVAPHGGFGGSAAGPILRLETEAAVQVGDILVGGDASGLLNEDNGAPPVAAGATSVGVVGVAGETQAAAGELSVYPAFPHIAFEANMSDVGDDYILSATPATAKADLNRHYGFEEPTGDAGYATLDHDQTAALIAYVVGWGRQGNAGYEGKFNMPPGGVVNPRVVFFFASSNWVLSA